MAILVGGYVVWLYTTVGGYVVWLHIPQWEGTLCGYIYRSGRVRCISAMVYVIVIVHYHGNHQLCMAYQLIHDGYRDTR